MPLSKAKSNQQHIDTLAARADGFVDEGSAGIVPPIQHSTTYLRDENYELVNPENSYGRDHNDQVRLAERIIAKMEQGDDSLLFASGMAALSAVLSNLRRDDTLLFQSGCYWGTTAYVRDFCETREIKLLEADSSDLEAFIALIESVKPTLVMIETPSNPWIKVTDVRAVARATKASGSMLVVDATAATPVLMQPLMLGADIVMHSATKAINGHTDVIAGVLTCADRSTDFWQSIMKTRHGAGAILSPNSAWLLIRGMRTLPVRIERMCENAIAIAKALESHPKIAEVWYPGLETHEGHQLASEQMTGGYGYLMSFLVKGGKREALEFCKYLTGIHRATSLGGVESLVEHRHTIEGHVTDCPENLIRLSVGIENQKDLIDEINEALSKI